MGFFGSSVPSAIAAPGFAQLDLTQLTLEDVPSPESPDFQAFLNKHFDSGEKLIESMEQWDKHSEKVNGTVQVVQLKNADSAKETRKQLGISEYWAGRNSRHTTESLNAAGQNGNHPSYPSKLVRNISDKFARKHGEEVHPSDSASGSRISEADRQAGVMTTKPDGIYERFRRGLLEYHSENEREYIESCRETECLQVFQPHVAEVWRLTYVTPPPTSPRTFVVLLLSREVRTEPPGERCFMNISVPFNHPNCQEKVGGEKAHVRGRYVSVERVRETRGGAEVEWKMATSSDAGGNIPRFVTNQSLPGSISEDVPSFLKWLVRRFPEGGEVESHTVSA